MCILVVEDEFLIRMIVAEELADAGFAVCEAENGDRAATLIESPPTTFSLLITDIHMPGRLGGIEVARLMRAHHPSVPIIFMTGRPDALARAGPFDEASHYLLKPFVPSDLLKVARRLLT